MGWSFDTSGLGSLHPCSKEVVPATRKAVAVERISSTTAIGKARAAWDAPSAKASKVARTRWRSAIRTDDIGMIGAFS
ncbi:hypothetical protein M011DRAFT_344402 [Sporormia fimetaria CBS 119925]|uniref:Uncharacterized protein n=1 Tax=Sporormia fimetaria CBS 119925 TaxID=1340428 RepID=A0A6A6VCF4_9PLEO|nr:hypothetical protein M011DRAFT_344402 [Sporormia fimetaria CBS 119925]